MRLPTQPLCLEVWPLPSSSPCTTYLKARRSGIPVISLHVKGFSRVTQERGFRTDITVASLADNRRAWRFCVAHGWMRRLWPAFCMLLLTDMDVCPPVRTLHGYDRPSRSVAPRPLMMLDFFTLIDFTF